MRMVTSYEAGQKLKMECKKQSNLKSCNCTYTSCDKLGICCECIAYHRKRKELPACYFDKEAEKTYDRSVKNFLKKIKI